MNLDADLFDGILPLVLTADAKSFGAAGRALGMTTSAVSKAVSKLESNLGVRLLHRTSRSVALTVDGEAFVARARDAVASALAARETLDKERAPRGTLRVTLPPTLGRTLVMPALPRLLARHPLLRVHVLLTNRLIRLEAENIDVALRIGQQATEGCTRRLLRRLRWATVASPEYLRRAGTPQRPADLAKHNCLRFVTAAGELQPWLFTKDSKLAVEGSLVSDDGDALVDAAIAGVGVVQAHDAMVAAALEGGRLVEILGDYAVEGPPVYLVATQGRSSLPRVRIFSDFVGELFEHVGDR